MSRSPARCDSTFLHVAGSRSLARSVERTVADSFPGTSLLTRYEATGALDDLDEFEVSCLISQQELSETTGLSLLERARTQRSELWTLLYAEEVDPDLEQAAADTGISAVLSASDVDQGGPLTDQVRSFAAEGADTPAIERAPATEPDGQFEDGEAALHWYETAVKSTWDGLVAMNSDLEFEFVNDTFVRSVGVAESRLLEDANLATLLDAGVIDKEAFKRIHADAVAVLSGESSSEQLEIEITSPVGGLKHVEVRHAPIGTDDVEGVVATVRDVTARKRRERQLQARNDRLEEFAHVISHDLRGPLNVATNRTELAQRGDAGDHLAKVIDALERMERMIGDLLELAKEGDAIEEEQLVGLREGARTAWHSVETREATLTIDAEATIRADRARMEQLLANLYRNAVEHAGPDVSVTVGRLPHREGFYVADDGPGIPPDRRADIFDTGHTTAEKGTGYGLTIVTTIAEAHGWEVDVTESVDGGARFELTGVECCQV